MSLSGLLDAARTDPALSQAARRATADAAGELDLTAPESLRPFVVATLAAARADAGRRSPVLAVTATGREADDLAAALTCLLRPDRVAVYPAWETLPHEKLSPRADTIGRRLAVLRRLAHPSTDDPTTGPLDVVIAPVRSVLQPQLAGLGELEPVGLQAGDTAPLEDVVERLVGIAYARVDLVEKRGEFAVRGGILDVFPPTEEHPVRVEFWGDEVEEVRYFAVADQRSLEIAAHGLWAPPCRELLLTPEVRERASQLAKDHPALAEMLDKVADGIPVEGMESLTPALLEGSGELELLVETLPAGTHVLLCDPERIRARARDLVATSAEFLAASWAAAAGGGEAPIDLGAAAFRSLADVRSAAIGRGLPWWTVAPFGTVAPSVTSESLEADDATDVHIPTVDDPGAARESLTLDAKSVDAYRGDTARAVEELRHRVADGWRAVLVFEGPGSAQRATETLREADLGAQLVADVDKSPEPRSVLVTTGQLAGGFLLESAQLVVFTESDLTGARAGSGRERGRMPSRRRNAVDPLQLQPGDYVVHEQHGVGKYVEMIKRTINGGEREYLVLEYAPSKRGQPGDRLFVPTDSLEQLTRYVGGEQPALHKMGGADWQKAKGRARKAVKEIAGELIRLYAARTSTKGFAFSADTPWQRELEDAFPYVETPDQLGAINEVKGDMEKPYPMDRVICGDVGYGKTEIAVRAAFKAVQDGKQVAVLVPTTILAKQHFLTFSERMSQFPVVVAQLSRFQTDAEAAETVAKLASGEVDIVVGTHRLLQSSTRFKDLGLVIVDEEQRFGVEHKEQLKQMRTAVDVLTMSATPIPRTLEMSLTGIREMSTILTPPEERHPVLTFVGPYEEKQIGAAIRRELLREGQVFYLHNRVESIERAAARLRNAVPEARVAVAHGQMNEDALERVMLGFDDKEYDVLVSTTIVESGLDIPNANTLIVERADVLGLSQLHQIRGRVGRGRERAYAYFLYPPERPLTETAHDRLATIAQNSDLGAGMAVAMKDLEIRGSGNLLGGEQSGHIANVGFDLYVRLVGEAVAEYKGERTEIESEVKVDLPVDAHLPHDYIPGERLRLEAYRKLAGITTAEDLAAVREEIRDRYGNPPEPVENLFAVAAFRVKAKAAHINEVSLQGKQVRFAPMRLAESKAMRLQRLYPGSMYKQAVDVVLVPRPATARVGGQPLRDTALLDWAADFLDAMSPEPARV
ncbi:transcription-repair coupling factor [Cryptosporangium aurantiacum]|uniref:Transcription-repair-coupling factor n=1 Tax=Cryptosporangium aurantiacum TaxID=134849 RepID=A0A1M7RJ46_9ACTN|nr:transcription-repair coupling factor [Cryptosporangium aurantiacum]SHN46355.1 transcription-repair coupling factor [Cryptosporangium aurantiacum]